MFVCGGEDSLRTVFPHSAAAAGWERLQYGVRVFTADVLPIIGHRGALRLQSPGAGVEERFSSAAATLEQNIT